MLTDNLLLDALKKRKLAPGVAYLARPGVLTLKSDSSLSLNDIESAWACVAANVVKKANEEFVAHIKSGKDNGCSSEQVKCYGEFRRTNRHPTAFSQRMCPEQSYLFQESGPRLRLNSAMGLQ